MKYIITLSLLFSLFVCKSQKIDYNNFDKKLFEKVLFDKLNYYRKLKKSRTINLVKYFIFRNHYSSDEKNNFRRLFTPS